MDKWFPENEGYEKSNRITLKMLLSNTSGIPDYVGLIDSSVNCTPRHTIDVGYKNRKLAFTPGDSVLYSNTGFNMAGVILETESSKSVNKLIDIYYKNIAPSIRMDDGKGNYPKGYLNPWPYHYSQSGFAGGLIGTIEDYLKMMSFIAKQTEYQVITDWVKEIDGIKWGLGLFGQNDVVMYHGNSGVNYSLLLIIKSKILYFHSTRELNYNRFQGLINKLVPILMKQVE
ncbi:MAG: beta-lactamase family protein [Candidatus Cloacimonetes bacterium]|nr:beta-lactamase family protein [Candidatus Cloacimonadota bacterium]